VGYANPTKAKVPVTNMLSKIAKNALQKFVNELGSIANRYLQSSMDLYTRNNEKRGKRIFLRSINPGFLRVAMIKIIFSRKARDARFHLMETFSLTKF
jgi:hypothetical protein